VRTNAQRTDPVLEAGTRVGDFVIRELLGEGAMGQVYLAQDTVLDRRVALKLVKRAVLQGEGAGRFLAEARATASFNHPHIVTLYAVGEHEGRPYLALEFIDGESLRARLAEGPLPIGEALRYCRAVADAIAEAHRRGLVHADLKPENIVLARDGRVRVVDFGLARLARGASNAGSGTPAYMAPERWRGAPPTGAIDIWALGVTLHELVTGVRPFPEAALLHLSFTAETLPLSHLPPTPWAQIIRACLALDPAARPPARWLVYRLSWLIDTYAPPLPVEAGRAPTMAVHAHHLVTELAVDEADLARGVLRALVGPAGAPCQRRRSELIGDASGDERAAVEQLIDRLVARHLLIAMDDDDRRDPSFELAYEAIATAWPQLARWLEEVHTRHLRVALSARNAGPPADAWLAPVVTRMVRRELRDRPDRRFQIVERSDETVRIDLVIIRAGDQFLIDAVNADDARVVTSAVASSVACAVRALAIGLRGKLGAGFEPAGPDPEELEGMRRISATSVELFRRYRRVLHAYYSSSLPDVSNLSAETRRLIDDDPEWAHPHALLATIEGQSTNASRTTLAAARSAVSATRDPAGAQLIDALEMAAKGDAEAAFQIASELFRRDNADILVGVLLTCWALLAQRTEEAEAIIRRLHAASPELAIGLVLVEWLRWEARDGDADRLIHEWVAAAPENLSARVELVRIEANAGRMHEAQAQARQVMALHGERDDALPELFDALVASQQISSGRAIADQMLAGSLAVRAFGRYRIALTSVLEGRFAAAYDAIRRAVVEHRAFGLRSELTQCLELARSIAPLVADVHSQRRYTEELATAFATMVGDAGAAAATRFELALLDSGNAAPVIDDHLAVLEDGPMRDAARRRMLRAAALAGHGSPQAAIAAGFSTVEENTGSLVAFGLCALQVREFELARWSFERATRQWSSIINNQSSPFHAVLARFHLAVVLEELDERVAARTAYESFLRCWSAADRLIPEVALARKALDRIGGAASGA
jgi:tRNA A-37 threonylcarbamoyl transferase component Bud32